MNGKVAFKFTQASNNNKNISFFYLIKSNDKIK